MDMEVVYSRKCLCTCCMEEHEVKTVRVMERTSFKDVPVEYEAVYFYCDEAEELYMDEEQAGRNAVAVRDAYRKSQGLLTSGEIVAIRRKYGISQKDLCTLLGWGGKTITRYEGYQVQDKAHDTILKKIGHDPGWFLDLLKGAEDSLLVESYHKYFETAAAFYEDNQDSYLRRAIEARYAKIQGNSMLQGNTVLSLDKVVDVIRYFAAADKVTSLYKVKLMKLMWYSDQLSYKRRGSAITGLAYQALPMGAVPVGHGSIINLKGVPCEEVDMGETYAYHFSLQEASAYPALNYVDKEILDMVIRKLGKMTKREIVEFMHKEKAYTETAQGDIIRYKYADSLQI